MSSSQWKKIALAGAVVLASSAAGCAGILGIEKAEHDEKLDGKGGRGGSASGTGGETGVTKTLCERYCDAVMENCSGAFPVYRSRGVCDEVCKVLPAGRPGDVGVNSIECRLTFANLAKTIGEEDINCPAAGPGGDDVCGANCDGFCTIALAACPESPVSGVGCEKVCTELPEVGGYNSNIETGNSVECRLYHASAATIDPATHCKHTAGVAACLPAKP